MNWTISRFAAAAVALLLLAGLAAPAWADGAVMFVYHRFGDSRYPSTNIAVEVFAAQLEYLKHNNYTVLTAGEVARRLRSGVELPPRCVSLTVDDGYTTFLTGAMPLLRRYHYPATLFVASDSVGRHGYLSWEQLRSLEQEGVEIGNHSAAHPYFVDDQVQHPDDWRRHARADIERAQQAFTRHLGHKVALFAYPYGEYSPALAKLVRKLGFAAAFAQQSGVVDTGADLYALPRFPMGGGYATLQGFSSKARMRRLPVTDVEPLSPLISRQDPPELTFTLANSLIDTGSLRCYVQGQNAVSVELSTDGRYHVRAHQPLAGRRNKYTVTGRGRDGKHWYWFSHLWVHPRKQVAEKR